MSDLRYKPSFMILILRDRVKFPFLDFPSNVTYGHAQDAAIGGGNLEGARLGRPAPPRGDHASGRIPSPAEDIPTAYLSRALVPLVHTRGWVHKSTAYFPTRSAPGRNGPQASENPQDATKERNGMGNSMSGFTRKIKGYGFHRNPLLLLAPPG